MKAQTRPFVVVTERRRPEHAEAEAVFSRKSVFRDDLQAKPITKEDVRAGLEAPLATAAPLSESREASGG